VSAVFTYVVDENGRFLLADRQTEHCACAGGRPVLAAGEIGFELDDDVAIEMVSNLSTGYCPRPECFEALARCLQELGLDTPSDFTDSFEFRRCPSCGQFNVVKDEWMSCAVCDGELPATWKLDV